MINNKTLILYFGALVPVLFHFSCNKCSNGNAESIKQRNYLGNIPFYDSTKYWLDSIQQDFIFINDSNDIKTFKFERIKDTSVIDIRINDNRNNCEASIKEDYVTLPIREYIFSDGSIVLKIRKTKFNGLLNYSNLTAPDLLVAIIDNLGFIFRPSEFSDYYHQINYPSITLGKKEYSDVIFSYWDTSSSNQVPIYKVPTNLKNGIYPYGIYYKFPKGIIGFTFSNGNTYYVK